MFAMTTGRNVFTAINRNMYSTMGRKGRSMNRRIRSLEGRMTHLENTVQSKIEDAFAHLKVEIRNELDSLRKKIVELEEKIQSKINEPTNTIKIVKILTKATCFLLGAFIYALTAETVHDWKNPSNENK